MLPDRPILTLITSARIRFRLNPRIESRNVDHDAAVSAIADRFLLVSGIHAERQGPLIHLDELRGGRYAHADGRRGEMPDVEVDAEALMARRQQLLTAIECRRLDEVDQHGRR